MSKKVKILKLCNALGIFTLTKWLYRRRLQILCYHGFECEDESQFRPKLFISERTFLNRLNILKESGFNIVPLSSAVPALQDGSLPNNSIVITIDDGFYNVLKIAAPALSQFQFPSTLYLTTYYSIKEKPIFRLVVQYLFWKTNLERITLSEFDIPEFTGDLDLSSTNPEIDAEVSKIYEYGEKHLTEDERVKFCSKLSLQLNVDIKPILESRMLGLVTLNEAKTLIDMGMDIQLHTHRHTLSQSDQANVKKEILENREMIQSTIPGEFTHFCYPSGQWNEGQWPWLASVDIATATTCDGGFNTKKTHPLGLTRFLDGENISDIEFKAEVYGFLELMRNIRKLIKKLSFS